MRTEAPTILISEETEALISKVFTWLLGGCLVTALAALIYAYRLGPGYTGPRYQASPVLGLGRADGSAPHAAKTQGLDSLDEERARAKDMGTGNDALGKSKVGASKATSSKAQARSAASVSAKAQASAQPEKKAGADLTATQTVATDPVAVTMYSAPWCFICDRAREFLLARDVALTDINIERDRAGQKRLHEINPTLSLPTFEIEGRTRIGFNPWQLQDEIRDAARQRYSARVP
jgi:glutaredoxin